MFVSTREWSHMYPYVLSEPISHARSPSAMKTTKQCAIPTLKPNQPRGETGVSNGTCFFTRTVFVTLVRTPSSFFLHSMMIFTPFSSGPMTCVGGNTPSKPSSSSAASPHRKSRLPPMAGCATARDVYLWFRWSINASDSSA
jgi:hypothetical protein